MKLQSDPQYAQIEQPFGCKRPTMHCPICGKPSLVPIEGSKGSCEHLAFIHFSSERTFVYKSENFAERTEGLNETGLTGDVFKRFLNDAGYGNEMLALEISHGVMACGPVWCIDVYGYDYDTLAPVEDLTETPE